MKIKVYDQEGKETGSALLPKEIFEVPMNPDLVWQVATFYLGNKRQSIAHTKNRAEVSGGGRKPWRQKGTGRARHGSVRSPLWHHGGVVFGPRKDKIYKKTIPYKMKKKATLMVLSAKAKSNLLIVLDKIKIENPKTKEFQKILNNLKNKIKEFNGKNALILLPEYNKEIFLAARNLPKISVTEIRNLNCLDLLSYKYLIMPKECLKRFITSKPEISDLKILKKTKVKEPSAKELSNKKQ